MARLDQEEQEKLDSLKAWWNRYGTIITIVLAVMVATFGGTKVWDHFQRQQAQQAADLYALLKQVQASGDLIKITDAAHLLTEGHASSGYAPRAAMIVAKASVDAGDLKRAKEHLQWIIDNAKEPEMVDLARFRMANILLDEKNYAAALQQLSTKHGDSFTGLYADLKGDVLLATGKIEEARLSYEAAVQALNKQNNYYNIVQMKADALTESHSANSLYEWAENGGTNAGKTNQPESSVADETVLESVEPDDVSADNTDEQQTSVDGVETDESVLSEDADAAIEPDESGEISDEAETAVDGDASVDDPEGEATIDDTENTPIDNGEEADSGKSTPEEELE